MENNPNNYLSLQEATEYCSYSQEYLSLRARQGKLKAVKFGRNWVTKKEWLEEYFKKVEEYNNKNHFPSRSEEERRTNVLRTQKLVSRGPFPTGGWRGGWSPPENLPVEKLPVLRFGFVTALVFVLLVAGCFLGRESFKNVYQDIEPYTYIVGGAGDVIVEKIAEVLAETVSDIPQSFATVSLTTASIGDVFKEYGQWIGKIFWEIPRSLTRSYINANDFLEKEISNYGSRTFLIGQKLAKGITQGYWLANDFVEKKISQGYRAVTQLWRAPEKIVEEKLIPKPTEEGMVVIPSTEKDQEVKEKIKESFSDEVKVEPKDKTSGIITPIFKEGEGQKYLYILVPVKN